MIDDNVFKLSWLIVSFVLWAAERLSVVDSCIKLKKSINFSVAKYDETYKVSRKRNEGTIFVRRLELFDESF